MLKSRPTFIYFSSNIRGSIMIFAIVTMMILSYFSVSLVQMHAGGLMDSVNHAKKVKAEKIALAGLEFAQTILADGVNPASGPRALADGNFQITTNPQTGLVEVQSQVTQSKQDYSMIANFSNSCIELDNNYLFSFGPMSGRITNLHMKKICHKKFVIERIIVSWTNSHMSQKCTKIDVDSGIYYDGLGLPPTGLPSGGTRSGEIIDNNDIIITDTGNHTFGYFEFTYDQAYPFAHPTTFTITFQFQDGSSVSKNMVYN